jgi:hypothetical protein
LSLVLGREQRREYKKVVRQIVGLASSGWTALHAFCVDDAERTKLQTVIRRVAAWRCKRRRDVWENKGIFVASAELDVDVHESDVVLDWSTTNGSSDAGLRSASDRLAWLNATCRQNIRREHKLGGTALLAGSCLFDPSSGTMNTIVHKLK